MKGNKHLKRVVAVALCAMLLFGNLQMSGSPFVVTAAENPAPEQACEHHTHDEACGYDETAGTECTYECPVCEVQVLIDALPEADSITKENAEEVTAQINAVLETVKTLDEAQAAMLSMERCTAAADAVSALDAANTQDEKENDTEKTETEDNTDTAKLQSCPHHTHDEACGYDAQTGEGCVYECLICKVQALIDALPEADEITAETAEAVEAQLTAIDEAKAALTDEQMELLNTEKYVAAAAALGSVQETQPAAEEAVRLESTGKTYGTIGEALDAAAGTDTITLLQDISLTEIQSIAEGKSITLDLAGHTLTQTGTYEYEGRTYYENAIDNLGALTIKDSVGNGNIVGRVYNDVNATFVMEGGKITGDASGKYPVWNEGTATIKAGTIITDQETTAVYNCYGGAMTIEGGTVSSQYIALENERGTLIINGGEFHGELYSLYNHPNSTLKVNVDQLSGTINLNESGETIEFQKVCSVDKLVVTGEIDLNNVTASQMTLSGTITSGTYNNVTSCSATFPKDSTAVVNLKDALLGSNSSRKNISGGTFTGTVASVGSKIELSGGTFSEAIYTALKEKNVTIASGYDWKDNADDTFSVIQTGTAKVCIQSNDTSFGTVTQASLNSGSSKFSASGELTENNAATVTKGRTFTFSATAAVTDDNKYAFAGWYANKEGTGSPISTSLSVQDMEYAVSGNTTIYAVFKETAAYEAIANQAKAWLDSGSYTISSTADMYSFAYAVNHLGETFEGKTVTLNADLDYSAAEFMPVGGQVKFAGTFDGGNHTISGVNYSDLSGYAGIFGYNTGTVKNLTVENCSFTGADAGGIAAWSEGTIENCTVRNCTINGGERYTGGIVGHTYGMTMNNVTSVGNTLSGWKTGGVAGYADGLQINGAETNNNTFSGTNGLYGELCGHLNAGASTLTDAKISGEGTLIGTSYSSAEGTLTISETENGKTNIQTEALSEDLGSSKTYIIESGSYVLDSIIAGEEPVNGEISINGGKYTDDSGKPLESVKEYVTEGKTLDENGKVISAVAKIGDTCYESVMEAVNHASEGDVIQLVANVKEDVTIPAGADITLDIPEGITLTNDGGHTITNRGTLTITGKGTVDNVTHPKAAIYNYGVMKIEDGTFTRSGEKVYPLGAGEAANSWYLVVNEGTMTIDNGTFYTGDGTASGYGNFSSLVRNYKDAGNSETPMLTINGGSFTNAANVLKNEPGCTMVVTSGTFTMDNTENGWVGGNNAIQNYGKLEMSGGTVNVKGSGVSATYSPDQYGRYAITTTTGAETALSNVSVSVSGDNTVAIRSSGGSTVAITGGSFHVDNGASSDYPSEMFSVTSDAKLEVSGGTFSAEVPEEYCAPGYHPTDKDADGNYTVCGHKNVTAVKAAEATCDKAGNTAYWHCPDCGRYFSDEALSKEITLEETVLAAKGHTLTKTEKKAATCTQDGNSEYYHCSTCGKYFADEKGAKEIEKDSWIIKASHTYGEWTVTKEATGTTKGEKQRTCSVCGAVEKAEIPALGHKHGYSSEWEWDGKNHWHECSCGEKTDVAAHTYDDWTVTKQPTADKDGMRETSCTVCGYRVGEPIPATRSAAATSGGAASTGDESMPMVWTALLVMAGAALVIGRKKYNK